MARKKPTAVLCSSCGKLISVEEPKCPHCGALKPALWGFAPQLRTLFGDKLDLVHVISMGCVGLYVISLALVPREILAFRGLFSIGAPAGKALNLLGMTGWLAWACGHWWTLLTANFLHGSLLHIAFNLMWIRALGHEVVREYGTARFFVVYMITGMFGFLLSNVFSGAPTIGASASIFGLGGLLMGLGLRKNGRVTAYLDNQALFWGGLILVFGFIGGFRINNWAHAGGLVSGFALAWVVGVPRRGVEGRAYQVAALALLGATIVAVGLSVWQMWPYFDTGLPPCVPRFH